VRRVGGGDLDPVRQPGPIQSRTELVVHFLGTVIERLEFGLGLGYRQFQISFPAWGRVGDAERDVFFAETCGRFGQAQFLHYNTPRGGRVLTGAEYGGSPPSTPAWPR
jgi:hypothetical protein